MTCRKNTMSACDGETGEATGKECDAIADVLEKITNPVNKEFVQMFIRDSAQSLQTTLFHETPCAKLDLVLDMVRTGTHTECLAIFYLLLNIDAQLKTRILTMDRDNSRKIGRFLQDLRNELVTTFFCTGQSMQDFVGACKDAYCIA